MPRYLTEEIEETMYIKNITDGQTDGNWCKVDLSSDQADDANKELQERFPELYNHLIPEIRTGKVKTYIQPVDIPEGAMGKISVKNKILQILARIIVVLACAVIFIHIIPTTVIGVILFSLPFYCIFGNEEGWKEDVLNAVSTLWIMRNGWMKNNHG